MIAGSSIGALVGACYAGKGEIASLEEIILKTDWKKLVRLADPNLAFMLKGFIHGEKVKELLLTIIGDIDFKDLKIPLAVVTTDVNTGEEVVIKKGSVIEAVRASISMPVVFMPVKFKDRFLIDGGVVNPIPVNVAKNMGAEIVIACNVIRKLQRSKTLDSVKKRKLSTSIFKPETKNETLVIFHDKINRFIQENKKSVDVFKSKIHKRVQKIDLNTPNVFKVIIQAIYAMEYEIAKAKIKEADIIITPDVQQIAVLDFYRGREAIAKGYKAARDAISGNRLKV
ncbi:MAG: patatin-like phospholipase family protein [Candidatus Kaelpia imicola]|nr:patatin-like phospholipase family protein [Candidatus Kaelpia imicola]